LNVLVTGGTGFVMSNVVRRLLEADSSATVTVVDLGDELDDLTATFLDPWLGRVHYAQGDVRRPESYAAALDTAEITHVVHAAAVTHEDDWEVERPDVFLDVNIGGTVRTLELARRLPRLVRFLYVSSGGVYGNPGPGSPPDSQPETGPFDPPELYAISKYTAELIARRYGEVTGIDVLRVRFSELYGRMERATPGRYSMSLPYLMVRALIEDRPFRIDRATLGAGCDFISSEDAAEAVCRLLRAGSLGHRVYNIAQGSFTDARTLADAIAHVAPAFAYELVDRAQSEYVLSPWNRRARWNAYAIDRVAHAVGWLPRPLEQQLREYVEWVMESPGDRCPAPSRSDALGAEEAVR
jgi:nucleoside-diphosphate-sugar epimerase